MANEFQVLSIKPFPDLDWDDIEVPEPVARASVAQQAEEDDNEVILTPEQMAREQKRLASIAARRAESAMLDAERKAREAEKAAKKRKEEEEEAMRRARIPKKTEFEIERDSFIEEYVAKKRLEDKKAGKAHRWANRMKNNKPQMSEGEVLARDIAMREWKILKKL